MTDVYGARPGISFRITVTITVRTVHGTGEYNSRHVSQICTGQERGPLSV